MDGSTSQAGLVATQMQSMPFTLRRIPGFHRGLNLAHGGGSEIKVSSLPAGSKGPLSSCIDPEVLAG